jgi:hypothetical protein
LGGFETDRTKFEAVGAALTGCEGWTKVMVVPISPFRRSRSRAADAGVELDLREGDMRELALDDRQR